MLHQWKKIAKCTVYSTPSDYTNWNGGKCLVDMEIDRLAYAIVTTYLTIYGRPDFENVVLTAKVTSDVGIQVGTRFDDNVEHTTGFDHWFGMLSLDKIIHYTITCTEYQQWV